jgi:uncharacterized protein YlzI (FlbEa/FlbD family)
MKTFKEGQEKYLKTQNRITRVRKEIERLKRLEDKLWCSKDSHWTDILIRPLLNEVKVLMPEITEWDDDRLTPMGLMNRVSVFPKYNGKTLYLPFLHGNDAELLIETKEIEEIYPEGSIAALNGMGKKWVVVQSAEHIVEILKEQMK